MGDPLLPLLFFDTAWRLLATLMGIGGVIFFHELGHFLVARWCGVRTEAFSLAFPPNLLTGQREAGGVRVKWIGGKGPGILLPFWKSERDPTEYRLGLIPLGGYVKMAGEGIGEGTGEPDELRSKSVGKRGAIFSAGVVMNVIFAFLAFTIAFQVGVPLRAPVAGRVVPGSPAETAGVLPGDEIVAINDTPIDDFTDVLTAVAHAEDTITLEVMRGGQRLTLGPVKTVYSTSAGFQQIGIYQAITTRIVAVTGPAAAAGMRKGDVIVAVDGAPVRTNSELTTAFDRVAAGHPDRVVFTVERAADGGATTRVPVSVATAEATHFKIGVVTAVGVRVGPLAADAPLAAAGLAPGDLVVVIGDKALTVASLEEALESAGGATVGCTIRRGETDLQLDLPTTPEAWADVPPARRIVVRETTAGSPAEQAGLRPGEEIRTVGEAVAKDFPTLQTAIQESRGGPIALGVAPAGAGDVRRVELRPVVYSTAALGIAELKDLRKMTQLGLGGALAKGWDGTVKFAEQVLLMLRSIAERRVSADNLGGPVTIARAAWAFTEDGLGAALYFLGILSVNLAILNVLPIPVLDGGHLFFLLIEAVRRRPVSENVQIMAQYVGLLLLLGLMVFVTVNDIGRLF